MIDRWRRRRGRCASVNDSSCGGEGFGEKGWLARARSICNPSENRYYENLALSAINDSYLAGLLSNRTRASGLVFTVARVFGCTRCRVRACWTNVRHLHRYFHARAFSIVIELGNTRMQGEARPIGTYIDLLVKEQRLPSLFRVIGVDEKLT